MIFIADSDGSAAWPRRRLLYECLSDSGWYIRPFADSESGMVFRDQSLIKTGVNRKEGLMVLAGVGIISLLLWGLAVRVKENLPKEREDI